MDVAQQYFDNCQHLYPPELQDQAYIGSGSYRHCSGKRTQI